MFKIKLRKKPLLIITVSFIKTYKYIEHAQPGGFRRKLKIHQDFVWQIWVVASSYADNDFSTLRPYLLYKMLLFYLRKFIIYCTAGEGSSSGCGTGDTV